MGALTSRRSAGVEEVDISTSNAYRYPPKSGCYFGSHFIMGGERFDTTEPEAYLFGENQDLNFLGSRPTPFPYPAPQAHEPTKTLKSLVNIRKDSLRFVKAPEEALSKLVSGQQKTTSENETTDDNGQMSSNDTKYNIEFTFDSDVRCAITVYYFASEEINNGQAVYHPRDASMNSETFYYKRGANQVFMQTTHIFDPSQHSDEDLIYTPEKETIPVVIQCIVVDEVEHVGHSHILFASIEKLSDVGYVLKPIKQKQLVDGLCYLLQEIYGIENKNIERCKLADDEIDDNGSECVICMSDTRDTLILPCRHLCLCKNCGESLRYQANNCPICRAPFRALLQIRAMRKKMPTPPHLHQHHPPDSDDNPISQEGVPSGYEAVSLLEALNGPSLPPPLPVEGLQPVRSMPPNSQPTSPEESPTVIRKKLQRHSSTGSRKSSQSPTATEANSTSCKTETCLDGNVPEVAVVTPLDSSKSPLATTPKARLKKSCAKLRSPGDDSIEIVNETDKKRPDIAERLESNDAPSAVCLAVARIPTPTVDYSDSCEEDEKHAESDVVFKPEKNTLIYEKDDMDELEENDPLVDIAMEIIERASLPDTPASNSNDGSSFGSNGSSHVLLQQPKPSETPSTA